MELIKRLFRAPAAPGPVLVPVPTPAWTGHAPTVPAEPTNDFAAQSSIRRELLRVRTRNTMRLVGIPESWLEPQVLLEPEGGRTFLHLRLVVRHWDERLLRYAVAFQVRLMAEIERIDPQAREWLLSIVWAFPPDIPCPYPELPEPSEWLDGAAASAPAAREEDELQADLAQLLAVRDADMGRPGGAAAGPDR